MARQHRDEPTEQALETLRQLVDRFGDGSAYDVTISMDCPPERVPSDSMWQEFRPGPKCFYSITWTELNPNYDPR